MHPASDDGRGLGAELEAISPELALVDPELAERARKLLPDPGDVLAPRPRVAVAVAPPAPVVAQPAEPARPRRRWLRTVVLAGLVFVVGAVAGGLLGEKRAAAPEVRLEAQAPAPSVATAPLRPPRVDQRPRGSKSTEQRAARRIWAANVLGVAASVDRPGVTLAWQRPSGSDHVVVVRTLATSKHGVVVYRGSAATYRDAAPLPCTAYRYTIVNYDRKGHRSTGVPTSVVTQGCA